MNQGGTIGDFRGTDKRGVGVFGLWDASCLGCLFTDSHLLPWSSPASDGEVELADKHEGTMTLRRIAAGFKMDAGGPLGECCAMRKWRNVCGAADADGIGGADWTEMELPGCRKGDIGKVNWPPGVALMGISAAQTTPSA